MPAQALHALPSRDDETRGLSLGLLGVAIFALTLPMTRMAVGPAEAPQLPPLFVTAGRAGFADRADDPEARAAAELGDAPAGVEDL